VLDGNEARRLILTVESRVLKRSLGPTAWAVLEDVVLDAVPEEGRWLARTSTRCVADHLGLLPGTVARSMARLCTEGIVHREDRRDVNTGRFGESVYVVESLAGLRPCVDLPHTVDRGMETPHTVRRAMEARHSTLLTEDGRTAHGPDRQPSSSGRRRSTGAPVQLPLLGDDAPSTISAPSNASGPTNPKPQCSNRETLTTHNPKSQNLHTTEPLNATTQRPTDSCQLFEQALPGAAAFRSVAGA
jgi:hypothetical protein